MDREKLDSLSQDERRKHRRFQSTAFLGVPLHLTPLPPYFGKAIDGQVINLSAGGMSILIGETLPDKAKLFMELTFPNRAVFASTVMVRNASRTNGGFLVGIQFLDLPDTLLNLLDQMSNDYIACDDRIERLEHDVCQPKCSFMEVCDKSQRRVGLTQRDPTLHMTLSSLKNQKPKPK